MRFSKVLRHVGFLIRILNPYDSQKHSIEQFLISTLKSPSKIIFSKFARYKSKIFFVMYLNALRYHLCLDIKNNSQAILFWRLLKIQTFSRLIVCWWELRRNIRSYKYNYATTIIISIQSEGWCISRNFKLT